LVNLDITEAEFAKLRNYVKNNVGISLSDQKASMVRGRLSKRVNQLGLESFSEYYDFLVRDASGEELTLFINAISTNVTSFFRSPNHWEFLKGHLKFLAEKKGNKKKLRIWSAACSSGEEPYTIAMSLKDNMRDFHEWDIKILATDISQKVLSKAIIGVYSEKDIIGLSKHTVTNHFDKIKIGNGQFEYQVKDELRELIMFRTFNLVTDSFGIFKNKFDIIFCRNVMIYFDPPTRKALVDRYANLLELGSLLFIGDSEALTENKHNFVLTGSSIYKRI
jgi:chemotaxis protein methyltransferase CheR